MNKRLPLGLLAILLIVLLAGVGVAYGLWSETLTIDGTVNTGEVNVKFGTVQIEEGVAVNGDEPESEPPGKEGAANCSYKITDRNTDSETLEITATGAYPSWHCFVTFDVKSTGTVPVHIYQPEVASNTGLAWVEIKDCYENDTQLHKNESASCTILIHFTNDDGVTENNNYTFLYQIEARQWNEPRPQPTQSPQQ
ncbi:MAG: hypothetical protein KatS3mg045_1515 [Bellilinea sp.]|nr:MAG: hypothetical protein KatS3mg045_1515 [Bellilinea sp.]